MPTWEIFTLATGDVVALIIFAAVGRTNHDLVEVQGLLRASINTAIPFAVSWIVIGGFLGAFRVKALYPLWRVIVWTGLAAIVAAPIGVLLRSVAFNQRLLFPEAWTFIVMAALFSALFLIAWRVLWSRIRRLWWDELP